MKNVRLQPFYCIKPDHVTTQASVLLENADIWLKEIWQQGLQHL